MSYAICDKDGLAARAWLQRDVSWRITRNGMKQDSLFEDARMKLPESIELTVQSMIEYGSRSNHWAIAYSGGKDSSATVTLITHLIDQGRIPEPESLTVLYADKRRDWRTSQIRATREHIP